jgi:hypothetical protein
MSGAARQPPAPFLPVIVLRRSPRPSLFSRKTWGRPGALLSQVNAEVAKKRAHLLTRHADASEGARVVEARAVVPAGVGLALVHVGLAARPRESLRAVAREGARGVDADAVVLAGGS